MSGPPNRLPVSIALAGAIVSLFPLLRLALSSFPSADDYCVAVEAQRGAWQMQVQSYENWTGRYTATLLLSVLSQWDLAAVYPWFCSATIAATLIALRAVIEAVGGVDVAPARALGASVVATAVLAGGLPSVTEAFFWMTSAVTYQWALVAYLAWLALLIRFVSGGAAASGSALQRAGVLLLTVVLPGFNEVMMPLVLATVGAFALSSQRHTGRRFMWSLCGIAAGLMALSLLAPGNAVRSSTYPDIPTRHDLEFALVETGRQTLAFVSDYGAYPALWMLGIASWWLAPRMVGRIVAAMRHFPAGGGWGCGLLLAAVGYLTLFPLYWEYGAANYTGQGRTYNVTFFVFCLFATWTTWHTLSAASARWPALAAAARPDNRAGRALVAGALAILIVGSDGTTRAYRASTQAAEYLDQQQLRESIFRASTSQHTTVVVDAVRVRPDGLFWGDIQSKPDHWINTCVAAYYGIKAVSTAGP